MRAATPATEPSYHPDVRFLGWVGCLLAATLVACAGGPTPPGESPRAVDGATPAAKSNAPLDPAPIESTGHSYELSRGSVRILGTLKSPVHIDAYVIRGHAILDPFARDLEAFLAAYKRSAKGKLSYGLIEATTNELRDRAKAAGLQEQPLVEASRGAGQGRVATGYLGLAISYATQKAVIPVLNPHESVGVEFWVTNKIREVRDQADGIRHRIGVVVKKGALDLRDATLAPIANKTPTIVSIMEDAFPFYTIESVDLRGGASPVDENLAGLIVTQPRDDFVEKELRRIDEFLMRGKKSLVVYASAVTLKRRDSTMKATLDTHGLERLLEGYGIRMNRDAVIDSRSNLRIPIATESGDQAVVRHCGIVLVANSPSDSHPPLDGGFVPFFRMDQVHFPFASSLTLVPNKQPSDVKALAVARTTPESSVETGATVDMAISEKCPRRPPLESRIVAAVVEGRLASAFGPSSNVRAPEPSRVFVVSSSEFLTNPFAYAHDPSQSDKVLLVLGNAYTKNLVSTILSFKNTIDWMVSEDDLLEASRRSISRAR